MTRLAHNPVLHRTKLRVGPIETWPEIKTELIGLLVR